MGRLQLLAFASIGHCCGILGFLTTDTAGAKTRASSSTSSDNNINNSKILKRAEDSEGALSATTQERYPNGTSPLALNQGT